MKTNTITPLILAGGQGTRLRKTVSDVPKPLAKVKNKPFLNYLFDQLIKAKFQKVIIASGYKHEYIENAIGNTYNNLEIIYSREITPLGTGGAIKKACQLIDTHKLLVMNGDSIFNIDLRGFADRAIGIDNFIACCRSEESNRYGTIVKYPNSDYVKEFIPNMPIKKDKAMINAGIYALITKSIASCVEDKFSLENDYLPKLCKSKKLVASIYEEKFIDIGIPDSYIYAQEYITNFT